MKKYCQCCGKETETKIITRNESYEINGEPIEVSAQVLTCAECGEDLYCEELDNNTLIDAYNKYRKKHKLLLPAEIRKIREQYGLSQRSFAKLLNWGDKTICRYENGSIQDKAHNSLLLFLRDPENMRTYILENEVAFNERQKQKLLNYIDELERTASAVEKDRIVDIWFSKDPCEENGYKKFDYGKLCAMVLYFANRETSLLKTKLMKLLHYSDMLFYKENGVSISGLVYVHLPYGPVPDKFDLLFGKMASDHIAEIEVSYINGYEFHQIMPDQEFTAGVLTDKETEMLNRIYMKFEKYGSAEISEYSHKEKGYLSTKQGEIISYAYAKDIQMS